MIQFFRKIRHKSLTQNKFSKYFLYAIGEIILIVIGILIALKINNWNEQKKAIDQERIILASLLEDLEHNKSNLEYAQQILPKIISSLETKLGYIGKDALELNQGMKDTLLTVGGWAIGYSDGTLNSIVNSGQLGLIRNADLKKRLTAYPLALAFNKQQAIELRDYTMKVDIPLMDSYVSFLERTSAKLNFPHLSDKVVDSNLNALLNDVNYQNILYREIQLFNQFNQNSSDFLKFTNGIIEMIQFELNPE